MLFLKSWRPISDGTNVAAIYVSRRASQAEPFGPPALIRPILAVGSRGADACSLSDDGATLYVGTYRAQYPNWAQLLQNQITTLPQLNAPFRSASGEFQFRLVGREGATYAIEFSPDLNTWRPLLTTNTTSSVQLSDPASATQRSRLYRVLSH